MAHPDEPLTWEGVVDRLRPARNYWLATTGADGAPHTVPVWGAVVGHDLYTYAERDTVKARNLARDDRAVVHLESAEDVLIVHGRFEDLGRPQDAGSVLRAFDAKYDEPGDRQYLPSADPSFDVLYRLQPARALLWSLADYAESQRRWTG